VLDGPAEVGSRRIDWHDSVRYHGGGIRYPPNLTVAQEIDTLIVRNSEQPRRQRTAIVERFKLSIRLEQRFLNDVLAV
jgi:hypothetical protein